MKRVFILIFSFFFLLNSIYGFELTDSSNNSNNYFSSSNYQVFIETPQNVSNFSVNYGVNSTSVLNLNSCGSNYCANFSLLGFSNATTFAVNVGTESKTIYLDTLKPTFSLDNYSIDKANKKVILNFSASDNFNISKFDLYKKENSNLIFISSLLGKSTYSYDVSKTETVTFVFKVFDNVENFVEKEENIVVSDIFNPQILETFVILEDNNYRFKFSVIDEFLKKYEIVQDSITLSEIISGTTYSKELSIPFNSGNINFNIIDENSNSKNLSLSLTSPFTNVFVSKFSNKKIFSFTSNADSCDLLNVDSTNINKNFTKSSNEFSIDLDIDLVKDYLLKISCKNSNFEEIFTKYFYYDTQKPKLTNISIENLDDGTLKILWDESSDNQSSVKYKLYRNGDLVYSGSKLKFLDRLAVYPNNYKYYLKVFDEAGNFIETDTQELVPKKVKVTFSTPNLLSGQIVEEEKFSFKVNTDLNSTIKITQSLDGVLILTKTIYNNLSTQINIDLELVEGVNDILIRVEDSFLNVKENSYSVIYQPKVLAVKTSPIIDSKKTISANEKQFNIPKNITSLKNISKENKTSFWLWILFWIVILSIFVWKFIIKEDELKKKISYFKKNKNSKFNKNKYFLLSGRFDSKLDRSLDKIKFARAQKQDEIRKNKIREEVKSNKVLSKFDKEKFKDINRSSLKKEIFFSINQREKSKKRINSLKKKIDYDDYLKEKVEVTKSFFLNIIGNFKTEKENKKDEFTNYIHKKKSEKSWSNTREYLMKTKLRKEQIVNEKINKVQLEKNNRIKEKQEKEDEIRKKKEAKQRMLEEKERFEQERLTAKGSLDDYLKKKTKKRSWFFAERDVDKDLKNRNKL